jgi:hypothetical protein
MQRVTVHLRARSTASARARGSSAAAVKSGGKSGGSRILRVVSHALSARLVRWPEHAVHYAREVWALGLSGEGGFTRAERLAMAQHWHEGRRLQGRRLRA